MKDVFQSVYKHFFVYGLGTMINRLVGFLLIPFYTHYLTPADYGTLELIELTVYVAGTFLGAGLTNAIMRYYFMTEETGPRRTVISTAFWSVLLICIVMGGVLIYFSPLLSDLIFQTDEYGALIRLALTTLTITVVCETPSMFLRAQQRSVLFSFVNLLKLIINLTLNIYFITRMNWGVKGIIWGGLLSQIAVALLLVSYTLRNVGWSISKDTLMGMFRFGLPYMPGGFMVYILNFSSRFFLQRFTSLTEVGLYALGAKFGTVLGPLLVDPFLLIWRPKMFEIASRPDAPRIYSRMFTYYMYATLFMTLGISIVIRDLIVLVADPSFESAYRIVPLLALAQVAWGAFVPLQIGIQMADKTRIILYILMASAALSIVLNFALVPWIGVWGAALSSLVSFTVLCILAHRYSSRYLAIHYEFARLAKLFGVAMVIYFVGIHLPLGPPGMAGLLIRGALSLLYPFALFAVKFYETAELQEARSMVVGLFATIRRGPRGDAPPSDPA